MAAIDAASGTSITSSTVSNTQPGSTCGRPMPSISVGRLQRTPRSRSRQAWTKALPAGSAAHSPVAMPR